MVSYATRTFEFGEGLLRRLAKYHRYEALGFEHIPKQGPALVVFHHSLATYDSFLLGVFILDRLGRRFQGLADNLVFRTPGLGHLFTEMGFVPGTREKTIEMLQRGEIIGLAPGGMREGLRGRRRKYRIDWRGRFGFVWTSMLAGAPIILAACPRSDDIYDVYDNPITPWLYRRCHLPLPLFRGRWSTPIPRPVKLHHLISEPIYPPVPPEQVERADVERHQAYLVERMDALMAESFAMKRDAS